MKARTLEAAKMMRHWKDGARVVRMNRYFFHVVGGERKYRDDSGLRFDSLQDATAHAAKIASELANDGDQYRGFAVSVTDEDDHELKRVTVGPTDAP